MTENRPAAISGAMLGIKKEMDMFGVAVLGLATGVGGGVLRDLLAGRVPYILAKHHLYATACLVGAIVGALLWPVLGDLWAMVCGAVLIFLIRLLAAHYRWSLPKAKE